MANPSRRGQVAGPVSGQMRGDEETPFANTSAILPYGLQLRQTINAGTTSVTIPSGVTFVYAIAVGGGGGGGGGTTINSVTPSHNYNQQFNSLAGGQRA